MKHISRLALAILCVLASLGSGLAASKDLKLIPEPRQVKAGEGGFRLTPKTRILVNAAHADQDRTAAEMLVEEIESATALKIRIATTRSIPGGSRQR